MTSQTQVNDLWSLYAQTMVRFDYYASEEFSESHQVANFERVDADGITVALQRKILHPNATETTSLKMFETQAGEIFREFHNAPRFNAVQMDIWQRIHRTTTSTLSLHDRVYLRSPTKRFLLKIHLGEILEVFNTNQIPLFESGDFEPRMEPLSTNTSCPGQSFRCQISWFCSEYSWYYLRTLMVAAMWCQDDLLVNWLQIITEIRCNTELCEEYQAVLPYDDLFSGEIALHYHTRSIKRL